ncbi:MAG: trehalose-phosphatase, partial [Phycisphaerae bacterium]|nr:trehalose-phosphatase [Phycisphaerae bacterium]NIW43955.1 trehalose-phosphatase [Gammaproteobacteria bacterium]NIX29936.1 trehalose-phosphatase [Phycisphaerae bacterium]
LELRVPGRDKGDAVGTILAEMNQDAVTAYLGDDLTDEDAFKAIKGKGIGILVREELRSTAADVWIRPPEELLTFLS